MWVILHTNFCPKATPPHIGILAPPCYPKGTFYILAIPSRGYLPVRAQACHNSQDHDILYIAVVDVDDTTDKFCPKATPPHIGILAPP